MIQQVVYFESEIPDVRKKYKQSIFLFLTTVGSEAVDRFLQSLVNPDRKKQKWNPITKIWSLLYSREKKWNVIESSSSTETTNRNNNKIGYLQMNLGCRTLQSLWREKCWMRDTRTTEAKSSKADHWRTNRPWRNTQDHPNEETHWIYLRKYKRWSKMTKDWWQ